MAYDTELADRIRGVLPDHVGEKKMFGGICFLDRGNMACGVLDDKLMLRLDRELVAQYRGEPHTADMDFTKRSMPSMMYVLPPGTADDEELRKWVERALAFTAGMPAK